MSKKTFLLVQLLVVSLFVTSCKKNTDGDTDTAYDRQLLLSNFSENIILPRWENMQASTDSLVQAIGVFKQTPSQVNLSACQAKWISNYANWQYCNAFNFGPGEKPILGTVSENIGTWPVKTSTVEERVRASDFNFSDFRRDSRGLLTVEYLLFGEGALDSFTNSANAAKRFSYLEEVTKDIKKWVDDNATEWKTYKTTFVSSTGKSAGSSTSVLYNEFVKSFEALKNFKIAVPAGKRAGQTQAEPQLTEAFYSGKSILFLKHNFNSIETIWRGVAEDGADKDGFDDYLKNVVGGEGLKTETEQQINAVENINNTLNNNDKLSEVIITDAAKVDAVYTEYQKMVRYFKSDLSSLLGIAITFSSGDGD
jgi:hypothetical protein